MLRAILFRMGDESPFANVFVENTRVVARDVPADLLLRRVPSPDGVGFVTPDDGEAYIRALPWAITDPQVWAELFDPEFPDLSAFDGVLTEDTDAEPDDEDDPEDDEDDELGFDPTASEPGDDFDPTEGEEFSDPGMMVIDTPVGRIEVYHHPGGKNHNQKNHTRHGYIRKNPKLAANVDAKIVKKDTVSAKPSNYAQQSVAAKQKAAAGYKKQADEAPDQYSKDYFNNAAKQWDALAKGALDQGKAKLGKKVFTDHGAGKLVAVGKQGTWGVVEIESLPQASLKGKATTRVGKHVIVDFEKVGIGNVAATKTGKSIGSEREKKAIKAAKDAANPNAGKAKSAKVQAAADAVGSTAGTTNTKNSESFIKLGTPSKAAETTAWNNHWNSKIDQMTPGEKAAISSYTGNGYKGINGGEYSGSSYKWGGLRNPPPDAGAQAKINELDSAMKKNGVPHNLTVYRGTSYDGFKTLKQGDTFGDAGFVSTSVSRKGAFSGDQSFEIRVPKGAKAVYVEKLGIKSERELLLDRSTTFKVVSRTETASGRSHFVLELLGSHNA